MSKEKNPDLTFAELFAVISAARINVKETCEILGTSRQNWYGWQKREWSMSDATRARAVAMIRSVRFYIERAVLPAHDRPTHEEAMKKIRQRVDKDCKAAA